MSVFGTFAEWDNVGHPGYTIDISKDITGQEIRITTENDGTLFVDLVVLHTYLTTDQAMELRDALQHCIDYNTGNVEYTDEFMDGRLSPTRRRLESQLGDKP